MNDLSFWLVLAGISWMLSEGGWPFWLCAVAFVLVMLTH